MFAEQLVTFSPTIENSNVNTVQYIATDGRSFTDMQQRDMTYTVSSPDRSGMVCQVTGRDQNTALPSSRTTLRIPPATAWSCTRRSSRSMAPQARPSIA